MAKGPKGIINGRLAPMVSKPNCVSSEADTPAKKSVAPFEGVTLAAVKAAIHATGGTIHTARADYLAATYTSKLMKFVDDVEVRMDGTTAHIRSASRLGYSDRGVNRQRVEAIRTALHK